MYDRSKESCAQGLHFFFLHRRALTIYGDVMTPKLKKADVFSCN